MSARAFSLLSDIAREYERILGASLTGFYAHGSLALDSFTWETSDLDFIVVVDAPLSQARKEEIISVLLRLDPLAPRGGFEMSVVLRSVCAPFVYPTPFELHFSNMHKARFQADPPGYCEKMRGTDKDLAAHFSVIRRVGIALCGAPIADVFAPVPRENYLDSVRNDIACAREDAEENPVYVILTLCRVLALMKNDFILSKRGGGEWGLCFLPARFAFLLRAALSAYAGEGEFSCAPASLSDFLDYMLEQIGA